MDIFNKKIFGNESGNAGVAIIVIALVIVVWFLLTTVLGVIQSNHENKKERVREMIEMRAKNRLPPKAFKAKERSTVVNY